VIDHGRIVASGTLEELINQSVGKPHRVSLQFDRPYPRAVGSFEFDESRTTATCAFETMRDLPRVLGVLGTLDNEPSQINVRSVGLQDVFLELTGRTLRE
jgi:ABC-2 type transport system ATP-binding protein